MGVPAIQLIIACVCVAGLSQPPSLRADQLKEPVVLRGKVVPLEKILQEVGSRLDRDAAPYWLGLVTAEGKIYPIIKDDGARRFWKDDRLLNRELEITARTVKNTSLLQVVSVRGIKDGKLTELFYWCDICAIKRFELNDCECCGGPMILKEIPVDSSP